MSLSHATESAPDVIDPQQRAATQTVATDAPRVLSLDLLAFVAGGGPNSGLTIDQGPHGGWTTGGPHGGW